MTNSNGDGEFDQKRTASETSDKASKTSDKAVERKITSQDNPAPGGLVCVGKFGRSRAARDTDGGLINERGGSVRANE